MGTEARAEFRAETHPPGTAPPSKTYQPNPTSSMHQGPVDMPGATSGEIHNASTFGRPMQGQTGRELHGQLPGKKGDDKAHAGGRKKERSGLEGVGATGGERETVERKVREVGADLPEGVERGMKTGGGGGATEMQPASATEVASERRG